MILGIYKVCKECVVGVEKFIHKWMIIINELVENISSNYEEYFHHINWYYIFGNCLFKSRPAIYESDRNFAIESYTVAFKRVNYAIR